MTAHTVWADRWPTVRLAYLLNLHTEADQPTLDVLSVYRDYGVIRKDSRDDNFNRTPADLARYQVVHPGDVVVNRMKAWQGSLGVSRFQGLVSPDYDVLRPATSLFDSRFLHHLLRSRPMIGEYATRSTGIRPSQWRLYWSQMKMIEIPVPEVSEQRAIADYLDRETARIDTLIEEQQRLIEMLRERRLDVIRSAVLGDINPFDPPPGTQLTAIGHHFSVTLGKMLDAGKSRREGDEDLPYIRAGNIQDAGLRLDDVNTMPYSASEAAQLNLVAGDLLVAEGGAVGTNVVLTEDMPGWSFQKTVNRLRPLAGGSSVWLGYILKTYRDIGIIDIICNKATIAHLTAEKLRALRVPDTDPGEQRRIAAYLDEQTAKIDTLIAETETFIELARERRSALITAAVTGQIDVREVA